MQEQGDWVENERVQFSDADEADDADTGYSDLAAFYTPAELADELATWAIRSGKETVLEPSIGGGALAEAVLRQAEKITSRQFEGRLFACDLNPAVKNDWSERLSASVEFQEGDFLAQAADSLGRVDVVIANPPFTRNHQLSPDVRSELRRQFAIKGAAGLWVHFLLHSMSFLREGGRLVSLVPAIASATRYGRELLNRLEEHFDSVSVEPIRARPAWHVAADEFGAIVKAEGYHLERRTRSASEPPVNLTRNAEPNNSTFFEQLSANAAQLGDIASLSIGCVTGRNRVFLLTEDERTIAGIDRADIRPVVSRAGQLRGLNIDVEELRSLAGNGEKTWLLAPKSLGPATERHLSQIGPEELEQTAWFRKRRPWWKVDAGLDCDAIFTYMNHIGPRMVMAAEGIVCTNTLHRVRFAATLSQDERIWATLSLASSFGQLAAERIGRVYGGGVLKFELMEARRLPLLINKTNVPIASLEAIDSALRSRDFDRSRLLADEIVLQKFLGGRWKQASKALGLELAERRRLRFAKTGGD